MKRWIEPIEEELFKKNVKIRFSNILDGFSNYEHSHIETISNGDFKKSESNFIAFLEDAYKLNCTFGDCYIEIYFKRLDENALLKLLEGLDFEDRKIIKEARECALGNESKDTIYYKVIDINIISILTKMCTRELFFVTFYFTHVPITIWGNYNLSFPAFYYNECDLKRYRRIICSNNMVLK